MTHRVGEPPIADLLTGSARRYPDKAALIFPQSRLSYRELTVDATNIARGLASIGIRPGDHVGLLLPNSPDMVAGFFGIAMLGAVSVPINTRYRVTELHHVIVNADLAAVLTTDAVQSYVDFPALLLEATADPAQPESSRPIHLPARPALVNLGTGDTQGLMSRATFLAKADDPPEEQVEQWRVQVAPHQLAVLAYTSGTTARPKGCMLTHQSLVRVYMGAAERFGVDAADRCWLPLPMFHGGGFGSMLYTIGSGATLISDTHFDPIIALRMIQDERATLLYPGFPAIARGLLEAGFEGADLSAVRVIVNIGPADIWHRIQRAAPHAAEVSGYGLTEAGGFVAYGTPSDPGAVRAVTSGAPLRGFEIRIVDDDGAAAPPNTSGEILVRGGSVFLGYYKAPQATAAILDADGWLHTGDCGYLNPDGHIVFQARDKDMLKVGGENVAPAEIESFLLTHPLIQQAQVVAAPDPTLREVPAAFVELRPDAALEEDDVVAYCRGQIASFKVPRYVRFVTSWPLSDSALKVQKKYLREQLWRELET